jgi:D-amino-acid dehydrogenase
LAGARHAVVIGGGAIGVCSAYYLSLAGWRVTLVERGEIGRGCSYGNACLIVPSHSHPLPAPGVVAQGLRWMARRDSPFYIRPRLDPAVFRWAWQFRRYCTAQAAHRGFEALLRLSRASLQLFDELARSQDLEFFFRRAGLLHVYVTGEGFAAARHEQEALEAAGFRTRLLPAGEVREFEPALGGRTGGSPFVGQTGGGPFDGPVRGGLFIEGEAHADSYEFVQAMAAACARRGVTVLTGQTVARVRTSQGRVASVLVEPSANADALDAEELPADVVVLAAGSWTPTLAATLGIRIPLQPAKGYSCTIDAYEGMPAVPVLIAERRVIITPLAHRVRFGGTLELGGFDLTIDRVRYGAVVRAAREVLREPPPMHREEAWCGLRPLTPDGLPVIDRAAAVGGVIVATGHAMLGFTQAPMTGKLVAELAGGLPPSVSIEPFRLNRFA